MTKLLSRLTKLEAESKHKKETRREQAEAVNQQVNAYASNSRGKPSSSGHGKQHGTGRGKTSLHELKKKTSCHNCGKIGHWASECRSLKKNKDSPQQQREQQPDQENSYIGGKKRQAFMCPQQDNSSLHDC